ncbi:MAG: sugar ABC transporter substrate-binding protein [bacterium]|nr:sugar ABC transporter substrate-binding protein [Candidatus Sumerlaeota bacterium]
MPKAISCAAVAALLCLLPSCIRITRPSDDRVILRYVTWGLVPEEIQITKDILAEFERTRSNIKIEYIFTAGGSDYYGKILSMIAAGTPPDVFYMQPERFAGFAARNALLDLDPYVAEDHEFAITNFYPVIIDAFRWEGRLYGLPADSGTFVLYYNQDLFDKAGVSYPDESWDWQALLNAAQKLTKQDAQGRYTQFGYCVRDWMEMVWQNGGDMLTTDGKRCLLNTPEAKEALRFYTDLTNKYHVSPSSQVASLLSGMDPEQMFLNGKLAMIPTGRYVLPRFRQIKNFQWDVAPLPKGKQRASLIVGLGFCIPRETRHPKQAWELAKYLAGEKGMTAFTRRGVFMPALKSLTESAVFLDPTQPPKNDHAFIDALPYGYAFPKHPRIAEMMDIIGRELEFVYVNTQTAEQACDNMTDNINQLLSEEP